MVLLWDDTYFERLWCLMEIGIFANSHDTDALSVLPLWLAPWLLFGMSLEWLCARWTIPLVNSSLTQSEPWFLIPPISPTKLIAQNVAFALGITVARLPSIALALLAFHFKLQTRQALLKQLEMFDVHTTTKCLVAGDRPLLEDMLARLYDEIDALPLAVAFDVPDSEAQTLLPQRALHDRKLAEVLRTESVRKVTSYPSHQQALEAFNTFIREHLLQKALQESGAETRISPSLCSLTYMAFVCGCLSATYLQCDGVPCDVEAQATGYASTQQLGPGVGPFFLFV